MSINFPLLRRLADGRFHSGEALAQALGVSRAAVWKQLKQLQNLPGIQIHAVRGRGYRLAQPLTMLDEAEMREGLGDITRYLTALELFPELESTNAHLMAQRPPPAGRGHACLAEYQSAGRGRRGRPWVSGFGQNLSLSLAWTFDQPMAALAGLSLAAGVAVAGALRQAGVTGHGLKWPNDLYLDDRKLAGILVEASGESSGPTRVVVGVGINLAMDASIASGIDQPWADLRQQLGSPPPRNRVAGLLIRELVSTCLRYGEEGLAPFLEEWQRHDLHLGREVTLRQGEQSIPGRYVGLAEDGALLLETAEGRRAFQGGEVSLRPAGAP
jgi:BirA family biotin operon repressor/biotin-[acetyl-CoA-carboxylase] ligase